jgi:hypothetical protein
MISLIKRIVRKGCRHEQDDERKSTDLTEQETEWLIILSFYSSLQETGISAWSAEGPASGPQVKIWDPLSNNV